MHAEHLEAVHGVGPHTISVPRICPADDINPNEFSNAISDEIFTKNCCCIANSCTIYRYDYLYKRITENKRKGS